jgi:hypothetical protein
MMRNMDMNAETEFPRSEGKLRDRFEVYLRCADDGNGLECHSGEPLKTFEEWLGGSDD